MTDEEIVAALADRAEVHYAGIQAVRDMAFDWHCPRSEPGRMRRDCPECVAEVALDAALAVAYSDRDHPERAAALTATPNHGTEAT